MTIGLGTQRDNCSKCQELEVLFPHSQEFQWCKANKLTVYVGSLCEFHYNPKEPIPVSTGAGRATPIGASEDVNLTQYNGVERNTMPNLNPEKYQTSEFYPYPRLTHENVVEAMVYRIYDEGMEHEGKDDDGKDFQIFVQTIQDPRDQKLYSVKYNKTSLENLAEKWGWNTKAWVGHQIIFTINKRKQFTHLIATPVVELPQVPQTAPQAPAPQIGAVTQGNQTIPSYQPQRG